MRNKKIAGIILILVLVGSYSVFHFIFKDKSSKYSLETPLKNEIRKGLGDYKVVFASSNSNESVDIWLADIDGSNEKCLTSGKKGVDMYPEWGPNGKYIYYTSNKHGGTLELYRVSLDGEIEQLSFFDREVRSLSVSADNKYIALGIMTSNVAMGKDLKAYSADLYMLEKDTLKKAIEEKRLLEINDLKKILSEPQENHIWYEQPDFQKNVYQGKKPLLSFVRTENYDNDSISNDSVWTIRADGSELKKLIDSDSMPRWTSDDKKIVTHGFSVMDVVDNKTKQLKIDGIDESSGAPSISPDGKYVIFELSDNNRKAGLARVIYNGETRKNPITLFSKRQAYEPRWSPVPIIDSNRNID